MATNNIVQTEEVEELEEVEADEEPLPTNAFPCPTCGILFSESAMCKKHTRFCTQGDEQTLDWTDERILLLIECMQARHQKYIKLPPRQRQQHWKLTGQIVGTTGEEARARWNTLTGSYNRVRIAMSQGRLRNTPWRFYNKMDKILGDGAVHRPDFVLSSMPLETNEDGSVQPHTDMLLPTEGEGDGGVSTSKLVNLMEERYSEYNKLSPKRRKQFWRDVGDELNIAAEEARMRWNMVVGSFKRTKINRTNHLNRYGREPRNKWRYYDQMNRIIGDRFNSVIPLMVLSSRQMPAASKFTLATGANLQTTGKLLPDIAPAPPRPADAVPSGSQPASATVYQLGPNGVLQAMPQSTVPPVAAAAVQATVLQAGTPQQQQADIDSFATKRKALFVEDYLRAKARREEQRLQLEERRIRALERLVDVMEAHSSS